MPFIRRGTIENLPGYLTAPLSHTALDKVRTDFAIGSHERWDAALVRLNLHGDRTDLYGKSPEEVLQILEAEENAPADTDKLCPFIVLDQDTEANVSVWFCERWASKEDWGVYDSNDEEPGEEVKRLPYLLRIRTTVTSVPNLWANLDITNITIPEMDEAYQGDPSAPYEIYHYDNDWENEKPPVAYVCAFPGEYEVSSDPEDTVGWFPKPERVVRLTEQAAKQLGLIQNWTTGWESPQDGEGAMSFAADRMWDKGESRTATEPAQHILLSVQRNE